MPKLTVFSGFWTRYIYGIVQSPNSVLLPSFLILICILEFYLFCNCVYTSKLNLSSSLPNAFQFYLLFKQHETEAYVYMLTFHHLIYFSRFIGFSAKISFGIIQVCVGVLQTSVLHYKYIFDRIKNYICICIYDVLVNVFKICNYCFKFLMLSKSRSIHVLNDIWHCLKLAPQNKVY